MIEDFIPYEEALALKELGFDEPCLGLYDKDFKGNEQVRWFKEMGHYDYFSNFTNGKWIIYTPSSDKLNYFELDDVALRPLYHQVFRWFREKHDLHSYIEGRNSMGYAYVITVPNGISDSHVHSYKEAELACLKKLIEIVKNKTNVIKR